MMTPTMKEYLGTIFLLQSEKGRVRSIDIAKRKGVTKATVHNAVQVLTESGYLEDSGDRILRMTEQGLQIARTVAGRTAFFTEILKKAGVSPEAAEEDAQKMGNAICDETFEALKSLYSSAE